MDAQHGAEGEGANPVNVLDPRVQANIIEQISGQLRTQVAAQIAAAMGGLPGALAQQVAPARIPDAAPLRIPNFNWGNVAVEEQAPTVSEISSHLPIELVNSGILNDSTLLDDKCSPAQPGQSNDIRRCKKCKKQNGVHPLHTTTQIRHEGEIQTPLSALKLSTSPQNNNYTSRNKSK